MYLMSSVLVDSRKSVSWGLILWKTTRWIDDLPPRRGPISRMCGRSPEVTAAKLASAPYPSSKVS
jgi:hypothetical protein